MKLRNNVGYHNKGEPYPQHDFSELEGIDLSWISPAACVSNNHIANYLESQYARNGKLTRGQYFYYTVLNEEEETMNEANEEQ
jgi:hypothetical protein